MQVEHTTLVHNLDLRSRVARTGFSEEVCEYSSLDTPGFSGCGVGGVVAVAMSSADGDVRLMTGVEKLLECGGAFGWECGGARRSEDCSVLNEGWG
jgi:hypothetical protein